MTAFLLLCIFLKCCPFCFTNLLKAFWYTLLYKNIAFSLSSPKIMWSPLLKLLWIAPNPRAPLYFSGNELSPDISARIGVVPSVSVDIDFVPGIRPFVLYFSRIELSPNFPARIGIVPSRVIPIL
jgi:hypothetical protein